MSFNQQTIIVTGAAGNLGAAIAADLAGRGAQLVLADLRREPLEALAAKLPAVAPPVLVAGADVRTEQGCAEIVQAAKAGFGAVHGLANSVGTFRMAEVASGAAKDFTLLMELNALTVLRLSEAVLPLMRAQGFGRIVHTAAGGGLKGFGGGAVYTASKAAVIRMVEAMAQELKGSGVNVNCVLPGTIDTPENRAAMPDADVSTWVQPADLAAVFAFLLSREAAAVHGAAVPVFGQGV